MDTFYRLIKVKDRQSNLYNKNQNLNDLKSATVTEYDRVGSVKMTFCHKTSRKIHILKFRLNIWDDKGNTITMAKAYEI